MHAGGYYREGEVQQREPNDAENLFPNACVGANATAAFGAPVVWGWADTDCRTQYVFMCKNASEWPAGERLIAFCVIRSGRLLIVTGVCM